ncbi:hypothetical protein BDV26DRAFT_256160 [Aspergillus bertholletiae]|uniref:Heterokaryon incompatibility domain-containing protein n=1 Tax=Aspergillus bertholletiae TaxID=1226010 RepID=A0A5N7BH73_9EURO|nr:hypothetical protein BDV26DRAFT_256160 [Aspergillus bertholletiae]
MQAKMRSNCLPSSSIRTERRLCNFPSQLYHSTKSQRSRLLHMNGRTWGQLHETAIVEEYPFHTTPNLSYALHHLRYPMRVRLSLVDYICIDQDNVNEKLNQILLMRSINVEATPVIIMFVEESTPNIELAV